MDIIVETPRSGTLLNLFVIRGHAHSVLPFCPESLSFDSPCCHNLVVPIPITKRNWFCCQGISTGQQLLPGLQTNVRENRVKVQRIVKTVILCDKQTTKEATAVKPQMSNSTLVRITVMCFWRRKTTTPCTPRRKQRTKLRPSSGSKISGLKKC